MSVLFPQIGEQRARVTASPPAQTSVGTTAGQILAANESRRGVIVQNTGTTVLKLVLGGSTPTQTVYHVALKAATGADLGDGGVYLDDVWIGALQAISSGVSGTCVVTEIT